MQYLKYLSGFCLLLLAGAVFSQPSQAQKEWMKSIPPELKRIQIPQKSSDYITEDILFKGAATGLTYGATLTKPLGHKTFPTVVLISGTGPQDRDYTAYFHKFFWVLADYLGRNGIAVLRMDDRGMGNTTGNFAESTSADFAKDMAAGLAYLKTRKDIDPAEIGLIGHSEGGIIAPMVYLQDKKAVSFMVLLAPPVIGLRAINRFQKREAFQKEGMSDSLVDLKMELHESIVKEIPAHVHNSEELHQVIVNALDAFCKSKSPELLNRLMIHNSETMIWSLNRGYKGFLSPWWQYILPYDPVADLKKVRCPILAIFGNKDTQVPPQDDYRLLSATLPANPRNKIRLFPGINHFMQPAISGQEREYFFNETTFAPEIEAEISAWINSLY